jgi:methionyl-tRNA formyltransferase
VLAGNSLAAAQVLELMLDVWDPAEILVVAAPDDSTHDWQPSLAETARAMGVTTLQPPKVNAPDVIETLRAWGPDLLLSVYYTQIFKPELLDVIAGPALNFHPALLPRHRGTAPLIWAIVDGDEVAGVSVHHLTKGIDTGPLVDQRSLPIHPDDTGYTLHLKASNLVSAMAARILRSLATGGGIPEGQDQAGDATYHSKRDPSVNHLDWRQSRERVRNVVRALAPPLPGAYSLLGALRLQIDAVSFAEVAGPARAPGMIEFRSVPGAAVIWAADGPVTVDACRVDGKPMSPADIKSLPDVIEGDFAR